MYPTKNSSVYSVQSTRTMREYWLRQLETARLRANQFGTFHRGLGLAINHADSLSEREERDTDPGQPLLETQLRDGFLLLHRYCKVLLLQPVSSQRPGYASQPRLSCSLCGLEKAIAVP